MAALSDPDGGFREMCRQAGVRDDRPLFAVLLAVHDAAQAARAAVAAGARGLTPEGEAALVERSARAIGAAAEGMVERRTSRLAWRSALAAAGVLVSGMAASAGAGYAMGWRAGAVETAAVADGLRDALGADPAAGAVWLRLMRYNDPVAALRGCGRASVVDASGWRGCNVPLWIERAGPPG
jgi:hypothetical protein